ncbi:MAG TPA: GNAT family N-acetyltransferase, partial [Candidatus Lokiarchaeia archaeon]|nr:GNAT family N-acetyltransferase [Candidatus Lokiarchaeia archaeon]
MLKVMEKFVDPLLPTEELHFSNGTVQYRTIVQKDLPAVKELITALARLFNDDFNPYWFDLYVQKFFQDPAAHIFIAEISGKVVGIAFAEVQRDPVGYSIGYISNIMVDENARGKGIGSQLLHFASSFLSHLFIPKIWANVYHDNAIMQEIFEQQGFQHKFTVMGQKINFGPGC